jgi:hypothetical protein
MQRRRLALGFPFPRTFPNLRRWNWFPEMQRRRLALGFPFPRTFPNLRRWNWFPELRNFGGGPEQNPLESHSKHRTGAPGCCSGEPVAMRTIVQLDRTMQLPLSLAGGLRITFADVGSSPLPERLAALVRRLGADRSESSGERDEGAKSRIDSRGIR